MNRSTGQGQLFPDQSLNVRFNQARDLPLSRKLLEDWQQRLHQHQAPLFRGEQANTRQDSLFTTDLANDFSTGLSTGPPPVQQVCPDQLNPLQLTALPLSFWRWPSSPHHGPAVYLVMDRPTNLSNPLLLYVGETGAADRRWKGAHDCKAYLAAYSEALNKVALTSQLSIRFWADVPATTKARRQLEQQLIRLWLPPFNKETRERWATPFTAESS
ncbi:MAG: GIY-YIG nuclease family protein [Prochlorococcus sp.]